MSHSCGTICAELIISNAYAANEKRICLCRCHSYDVVASWFVWFGLVWFTFRWVLNWSSLHYKLFHCASLPLCLGNSIHQQREHEQDGNGVQMERQRAKREGQALHFFSYSAYFMMISMVVLKKLSTDKLSQSGLCLHQFLVCANSNLKPLHTLPYTHIDTQFPAHTHYYAWLELSFRFKWNLTLLYTWGTWAFEQVLSTGFWSHQNTNEKEQGKEEERVDEQTRWWWWTKKNYGSENYFHEFAHTILFGGERRGLFIVIMQNGISNGWQLLKFYHAAIIGAYITEHSIA